MQTNLLFVYGSLLSGFKSTAYEYLSRYFNFLGSATVKGTMYDLGEYPVVVHQDTGREIKGELYQIIHDREFSYAMAQLDDYEGLYPEEGEDVNYEREAVDVTVNGEVMTAWVYWYNKDVSGFPIVEHGDMLAYAQGKK
ncbi:MAG: gamma-glutamylcyclotransferase [Niabella sp.]